jgi:hypothetical protein
MYRFFFIFLFPFFLHAKESCPFIAELKDSLHNEPVLLDGRVVFTLQPHQRFLCDTGYYYDKTIALVTIASGHCGFIPSEKIIRSKNQELFRITYDTSLFLFSNDTSVYARTRSVNCGWGGINWWLGYIRMFDNPDTTNVDWWIKRAFEKDTFAMDAVLRTEFGDVDAASQYEFNKWKVISNWNDRELASFILSEWHYKEIPPSNLLIYNLQSAMNNDSLLRIYYRKFYPLTSLLLEEESGNNQHLDQRSYYRLRRKISAPAKRSHN